MWNIEMAVLFISVPIFFSLFIYELLYYSEVIETEEWLGIKTPMLLKRLILMKPAVSLIIGLAVALYLVLRAIR